MRREHKFVVNCPKKDKHPRNKILLLLGKEELNVHCPIHGWLRIELLRAGVPINFENVSAKITKIDDKTDFEKTPIPTVTVGQVNEKKHVVA